MQIGQYHVNVKAMIAYVVAGAAIVVDLIWFNGASQDLDYVVGLAGLYGGINTTSVKTAVQAIMKTELAEDVTAQLQQKVCAVPPKTGA